MLRIFSSLLLVLLLSPLLPPSVAADDPATTRWMSLPLQQWYSDVPLGRKEAVSISFLVRLGIFDLSAPDRSDPRWTSADAAPLRFFTTRLVRRDEFVRMVMSWYTRVHADPFAGYSWYRNHRFTGEQCFPDISLDEEFGPLICEAYDAGFIGGYSDGRFHPERPVQYDEALKILTKVFGYQIPVVTGRDWGEPYYRAAKARGTDLPSRMRLDQRLSRGMVARLVAGFIAASIGQLEDLRMVEAGRADLLPATSSSRSSSSSSSSSSTYSLSSSSSTSSTSSTSSSSSSPSSSTPFFTLPLVSHFLIAGETSDAIASITVPSQSVDTAVVIAQVKLFSEARALLRLELATDDGVTIAALLRRTTTDQPDYLQTYEAQIPESARRFLAAGKEHRLIVRAVVRGKDDAGFSDNFVRVRLVNVTLASASGISQNLSATGPFPAHQTSFATVAAVERVETPVIPMAGGPAIPVLSLRLSFRSLSGVTPLLRAISFQVKSTNVAQVQNWTLSDAFGHSVPCSTNVEQQRINCSDLHTVGMNSTSPLTLRADITPISGKQPAVSASLPIAGTPTDGGMIVWTDGSGVFSWVEDASLDASVR